MSFPPSPSLQWQQDIGGICRYRCYVCGHSQGPQNNWLFTQHIHKSVEPSLDNYPVQIQVNLTYILLNCRERHGCKPEFKVYLYKTNTPQAQSTSNNGFMNQNNYVRIMTVVPSTISSTLVETITFELEPREMGFYLAIRDEGTCIGLSRMLVTRFNCPPQQDGLILYPDAPAPVSGNAPVDVSCVENGQSSTSATVSCSSKGMWGNESPVCGCSPGYEVDSGSNSRCNSKHTYM